MSETQTETQAEAAAEQRSGRPTVIGTVVSDKMDKTIVVRRDRKVLHPLYKKYVRRSTRFVAHDADNQAHAGDEVEIVETRPMSKTKRWRLVRILREAPRGDVVTGAVEAQPAEAIEDAASEETASEGVDS
jgi:small subunit ribosomal protein S17